MRTFAIGDIHGGLKALTQVLNQLELKDGDKIIFMGDYVDGWSESAQVVDTLIDLSKRIDCIFIKGNHDENRLFLHAGFTSMHGVEKEAFQKTFCLDRTLWEMTLAMDKKLTSEASYYPKRLQHYKEIYIGHTPTTNYGIPTPVNIANLWNIDTGAAFKGKITAINIETKAYFQSDNLPGLYPNEKGRN